MPGNHTVARVKLLLKSKIFRAMHDKLVKLFEGALVEQELDPFARGHLSRFVLLFNSSRAAALFGQHASLAQDFEFGFRLFALLF